MKKLMAWRCECGGEGRNVESRSKEGGEVRRRKECIACGERWSTVEIRADVHKGMLDDADRIDGLWRMWKGLFGDRMVEAISKKVLKGLEK